MIDFHSHILPGMDDGAKDTDESLALLHLTKEQGIDGIVVTPHFYPDSESPESFLERRANAAERLCSVIDGDCPTVYVGAEVAYFGGIGHSEMTKELTLAGTHTVLIEMPFSPWSEAVVRDLFAVRDSLGLMPVVAHIERYIGMQPKGTLERLLENDVRIQSNSSYFTGLFTKSKALRMLARDEIQFLGSDCHNMTTRSQTLVNALDVITRKLGREAVDYLEETTELRLAPALTLEEYVRSSLGR